MALPLILASTSRYRKELVARLGVPCLAMAPVCDEEALKDPALSPHDLAAYLALAKAGSLRDLEPGSVIIGCDQVVAIGATILGKPRTRARAEEQLALLAGKTHELVTAVAVIHPGGVLRHVDVTRLTMRPLSPEAIARYVAADEPLDCAGSYRLESRGITLFSAIESGDHTAIVGLPLMELTTMLIAAGYSIP